MVKKIHLSSDEQFRLRNILQAATLKALMASRRWAPGELVFQGGTSLHLAHGSARFSEDLDFMVRGGLSLRGLADKVKARLVLPPGVPAGLAVSVAPSREGRNPHAFTITLSGPEVIGSAKVKVELWQTNPAALDSVKVVVSTINSPSGEPAYVPTETLDEILADKIYALGARGRLKPRDVFDLWWLFNRPSGPAPQLQAASLLARLDIYPNQEDPAATARRWLASARLELSRLPMAAAAVAADLKRWLPSSWPMNEEEAQKMIAFAVAQLEAGIAIIQDHETGRS